MRTTLTLEDDLFALLEKQSKEQGRSMKDTINGLLRQALTSPQSVEKKFELAPRKLGLPPGMSYDNVEDLIERVTTPLHR